MTIPESPLPVRVADTRITAPTDSPVAVTMHHADHFDAQMPNFDIGRLAYRRQGP
jgi:hypothetical protein